MTTWDYIKLYLVMVAVFLAMELMSGCTCTLAG